MSLTGRVIVATRVPVAMDVGVQGGVTVGDGALAAVGESVAVEVFWGAIVPVDVGNGTVVGIRVVVFIGTLVGLGASSVSGGLVGLAGGRVGDRLIGLGVLVPGSVGGGATVCVAVATWTAAKSGHRQKLLATSEGRVG